jgi:ATP-dependent protease ClpP protease subunit
MGQPHSNYRANDGRSIFVTGSITQELIDRLTPQIRSLRAQSNQPITVYLDSPGGSTRLGAVLAGLLRCPGQDGSVSCSSKVRTR